MTVYTCLEAIDAAFLAVGKQAAAPPAVPITEELEAYEAVMEHRLRLFEVCVALFIVRSYLLRNKV